jgi:hypothetical protein
VGVIRIGELAVLCKKFDDREQIGNVFAAPLLTPEVIQKSLLLPDTPHGGSQRPHLLLPICD